MMFVSVGIKSNSDIGTATIQRCVVDKDAELNCILFPILSVERAMDMHSMYNGLTSYLGMLRTILSLEMFPRMPKNN